MNEVYNKFKSRKFWIAIAAILASIGASISGLVIGKYDLTMVGTICVVISSSIYSAVNAYQNVAFYEIDNAASPTVIQHEYPDMETIGVTYTNETGEG